MKTIASIPALLAGVLFSLPALVQAQMDFFPIATNGVAMCAAFDGTNYLVGIENHQTTPPTIGAQMISSSGNKIGSFISTGRSGISTAAAFDGTNYLLIWEDDGLGTLTNGDTRIYGQFISPAGHTNGTPFNISGTGAAWFDGIKAMAFGSDKYLVTYTRLIDAAKGDAYNNRYIAGRIVNPDGTLAGFTDFQISSGYGAASDAAFDGTNFFVVWREDSEDTEIRGRFVSPSGSVGTEISINASLYPSDNPESVTFNGSNYLVVWNDEVATNNEWDCYGQLVSPAGSLVGGPITITDEPGEQMITTVASAGGNFMAAWIDMQNSTNWDIYGQYIDPDGSLSGSKFAISTNAGNQMGGIGYANEKYIALVNNGVEMGQGGISQVDSATGAFITPATMSSTNTLYSDDFNDNSMDTNKWGSDIFVDDGTNATLTETNGRLEFAGSSSGTNSTALIRPWIESVGSYAENWEAAADIHLGAVNLSTDADISIFLAVVDASDATLGNHLTAEMELQGDMDGLIRRFTMNAAVDNTEIRTVPNYGYITTTNTTGRMRIAFDASTKILTVSYNGNPLGWLDVDQAGTSWGMSSSDGFSFALGGSIWGGVTNSGSDAYVDNFELRTGNQLDYLLTVNNGSGSGMYTNGVSTAITADTAPSGYTFDRWVGSTQYLANASSASTTITMPPQAISVTAIYKLTGSSTGDNFNDNSVNSNLWTHDIFPDAGSNAVLTETNGRLEFTGSAFGMNDSTILHPWIGNIGSYTQDWEIAADVHVGAVDFSNQWDDINMFLAVVDAGDALHGSYNDYMAVALYKEWGDYGTNRLYEITAGAGSNDVVNFEGSTADEQNRLRIAFNATTKTLTASYGGMPLASIDVDKAGTSWNMNDTSSFMFILGGNIFGNFTYAGHDVYADNFSTVGAVPTPADMDGNGLPDWWEIQYYGTIGIDPNILCSNGVDTIQEAYVAGLDPTDPEAFFGILGGDAGTGSFWWNAITGREYSIYWSTNLLDGFQLMETNYTGSAYTDMVHSAASQGFYKLGVQLQQ